MLGTLSIVCAGAVLAASLIYYPGEGNGVNPVPASENTWRACGMTAVGGGDVTDDEREFLPGEFFELEYGQPLAAFGFEAGFVRRWGCTRATPDEPGVIFPRGWGAYPMAHWAIIAEVTQDKDVSDWTLTPSTHRGDGSPYVFTVKAKPGERTRCFFNQGMIRMPGDTVGWTLACTSTNGVKGTVHAFKLVAHQIPVEFRKTFTLERLPAFAGASVVLNPFGEIIVNGQVVAKGIRVRTEATMFREDITRHLKVGENTVGYRQNASCGWGKGERYNGAMEFFVVDDEGRTTVYGSDKTWEGRIAKRAWRPVSASAQPIGTNRTPGGFAYQNGPLPMHAGALRVTPHGEAYPVFDFDGEVAYDLAWPKGVRNAAVRAVVKDSFSGAAVETAEAAGRTMRFKTRRTGSYEIEWTLKSGDCVVDVQTTEMVIAGPLGEKAYSLEEMEGELRKRLRLIHAIRPAEAQYDVCSSNFIGHTGLFAVGRVDCGKVIEECGVRMRETDGSDGAYLCWHVPLGTLGNAHVVEIDYSDAREQVIRSAVFETYPVDFSNNGRPYRNAIANATGSVRTGGRAPLTGKVQTLRYVFFPGSRAATVSFESGLGGKPAACSEIRIYEVEGGLPAWDAPKSDRVFMNHTERLLYGQWGAARHPSLMTGMFQSYRPRLWSAAFLATKNRVSQLKFEGHNAAIEGLYMYRHGFATKSGQSMTTHDDMDFFYLVAKMFRHNGLKLFAGWEYSLSPALWSQGFFDVSERDIWTGRKESAYHVDRRGRAQAEYWGTMGFDEAHPLIRKSMKDLAEEIYARYGKCGVDGLFCVCGCGWLPGIVVPRGGEPADVGFEDRTIREFEADTGLALGTNTTDPKRFQRRYELLTGPHTAIWSDWRARRARSLLEMLRTVVTQGDEKWRVLVAPLTGHQLDNPYLALGSTPYMRDRYQVRRVKEMGFDIDVYADDPSCELEFVPVFSYEREKSLPDYGALVNDGSRALIRKAGAVYCKPIGLNERGNLTQGVREGTWWWERTNSPVFETKYANGAAYCDLVDIIDRHTPKTMIHTWLDCNLVPAHDAALREMLVGYYMTPEGDGSPYDGVKGVTARTYGGQLQLVNNTPWTVRSDDLTLPPYAVRVVGTPRPMTFHFDADIEKDVFARLDATLADERIVRRLRPDRLARLRAARAAKDAYLAETTMRDWEVQSVLDRAAASDGALRGQKKLEEQLRADGVARINCGAEKDLADAKGRVWLKDQRYTGFGAYGDEFISGYFDRTGVKIVGAGEETDLCYLTEAGGAQHLVCHVPVPADGTYTLKVHLANTWSDRPGPAAEVTVGGTMKIIDPWAGPNGCKYGAHTETWTGLRPDKNGELTVDVKKCAIINGIEVIRE